MRKRSKYKPKGVRLNTMLFVMQGMQKVDQVEGAGLTLKIKNHSALANITQGKGIRHDVDILIAAFNVTEALAIRNIGQEYKTEIRAAQDCVLAMSRRGVAKDERFLFTGTEMQAVNLGMEIHDAQLEVCTVRELELALDLVENTIRAGKARAIESCQETVRNLAHLSEPA